MGLAAWGVREFQASFFDRDLLVSKAEAGTRKALSKFGAYVRQRARSSIRTRTKISAPGSPPSSHEGSLKRLIFFAFDAASQSVVIGPAFFKTGEAPRLLEYGGVATRRGQRAVYRPRPFMGPAAKAELPKVPQLLKGSVS